MEDKKHLHKPIFQSVLQKRQKRLHSGDGVTEFLPKMKTTNVTKEDIFNRLRDLIGRTCKTNAEKFHLLQRRDVLLYKLRDLNVDVGDRQATQGTCPDMCPEKERYMRDAKNAMHAYECDQQGHMVHEKMVKDYSRSAADQDTPLAHELRPLKTLQFTMDYLIFNIASEIPNTNAEMARWYDFLWSRTRAIRKDITQQMLNNELAVDLVEKCVRLHIFASFRLVRLEADLFDHKMNTENLSKSLQTLRHMYEDLAKKHIYCSNEPEFRAYDIILNLSDFNVHSQVLSYRSNVRSDPLVQLALSLAAALQNNNYIRFFRLIRHQATFLQACLCHHFFNLVRLNALKVICMAYFIFPLDTFAQYLAFDSLDDATKFLRQFYFEMDDADPNLINVREGRNVFLPGGEAPSLDSIQQTYCQWIELKAQDLTLPKILSNNPSATYPDHLKSLPNPVNSFSANNNYSNDPVLQEVFEMNGITFSSTRKTVRIEAPPSFSFARPFQNLFKINAAKQLTDGIALSLHDSIIENVVSTELSSIANETWINCVRTNLRLKRAVRRWILFTRRKKQRNFVAIVSSELAGTLFDKIVNRQLQVHAEDVYHDFLVDYNQQMAYEIASNQEQLILDKIIPNLLYSIACRTRANEVRHIKESLDHIRENLHKKWLRQFTDHWLRVVRRNRVLRNITFLTPGTGSSALTLSPTRRLFRPNVKKLTPERLKEMLAEREKRIVDEERRRILEAERDERSKNGIDERTISPAVAIREHVLNGVSFQHDNRPIGASSNLHLFRPGVKQLTPEMLKTMAQRKWQQNSQFRNGGDSIDMAYEEEKEMGPPNNKRGRFFSL